MIDEPSLNPYQSPDHAGDRVSDRSRTFTILCVIFCCASLVAAMIAAHVIIRDLDRDDRPSVFLVFSLIYLLWPFLCFVVPKPFLVVVMLFPFFGIWLGMRWVGDIGDTYMFEAFPPCCAGVWSIFVGGTISTIRCYRKPQTK